MMLYKFSDGNCWQSDPQNYEMIDLSNKCSEYQTFLMHNYDKDIYKYDNCPIVFKGTPNPVLIYNDVKFDCYMPSISGIIGFKAVNKNIIPPPYTFQEPRMTCGPGSGGCYYDGYHPPRSICGTKI